LSPVVRDLVRRKQWSTDKGWWQTILRMLRHYERVGKSPPWHWRRSVPPRTK
jgi:hypothetical protein